jgi:hypothetical protein
MGLNNTEDVLKNLFKAWVTNSVFVIPASEARRESFCIIIGKIPDKPE